MKSRGTIAAKYEEQGNYLSKIRRAGELFEKNIESRGTVLAKYEEQGNYLR